MLRNLTVLAVVSLAVSACGFTPQGDAFRQAVSTQGAKAYDEGLVNAEWFICQAASVGSIKRRYGKDAEAADAWKALCDGEEGVDLIGPSGAE